MLTLYVLQLEHNCCYIGITNNLSYRLYQHHNGQGSIWTRKHKPLGILKIVENVDNFDEDKYVKMYMAKYGIDKVRGGSYVTIDLPDSQISTIQKELQTSNNACFNCGKPGHYANRCKFDKVDKIDTVGMIDINNLIKNEIKTKLYVLKLENDCYYIGTSTNLDQKLMRQFGGRGAMWIKKNKPIKLISVIDDIANINVDQFVKNYMAKYGIDKVRGGSYTRVDLGKTQTKMLQTELACDNRTIKPKIVEIKPVIESKIEIKPKVIEITPKVVKIKPKPKVVEIKPKPKVVKIDINKIASATLTKNEAKIVNVNLFFEKRVTIVTFDDDILIEHLVKVITVIDDIEELDVKIVNYDLLNKFNLFLLSLKFW